MKFNHIILVVACFFAQIVWPRFLFIYIRYFTQSLTVSGSINPITRPEKKLKTIRNWVRTRPTRLESKHSIHYAMASWTLGLNLCPSTSNIIKVNRMNILAKLWMFLISLERSFLKFRSNVLKIWLKAFLYKYTCMKSLYNSIKNTSKTVKITSEIILNTNF